MKRFLISIIACLLLSISGHAQMKVEAVAGVNFCKLFDLDMSTGMLTGYQAGLKGEYKFKNNMYTNVSALFSLQGGTVFDILQEKLYYLNVPIHVGYEYPIVNNFSFFGEIGPYAGYGLFGTAGVFDFDDFDDGTTTEDIFAGEDAMSRLSYGLGVKFGFRVASRFSLHAGYDFGLIGLDSFMSNMYLGVGFRF